MLHSLLKQPAQRTEREIIKIRFLLAKHPAFQHLGEKALHKVSRSVTVEQHRAGDIVYRLGEPVERVYFVESGSCEQYRITPEDLKFLRAPVQPERSGRPVRAAHGPGSEDQETDVLKLFIAGGPQEQAEYSAHSEAERTLLHMKHQQEARLLYREVHHEHVSAAHTAEASRPDPPLLYSTRARSMLKLSGLAVPLCRVWMLKRGAATLDEANWVSMLLDVDDEGVIHAQSAPGRRACGPLSLDYSPDRGADGLSPSEEAVGSLREVWRVEQFSLKAFKHTLRVEFTRGDFLCVCFETDDMQTMWAKHLRVFRDAEDQVTRTLIAKRRADSVFIAGDVFGAEEMRKPNPIEAQSSPRDATVICKKDALLFVLQRFDFLCTIEKSPIFSLQERIETLKLACILPTTGARSLFKAARALQPEQYLLNQVVCRAGMRAQTVYVVFRGFASICEDNLQLQVNQDRGSLTERGSTYNSRVRRVEKLGVGDAFGHLDAVSENCVYQHTLIADTNKTVILRLPLAIFLECWEGEDDQEADPESLQADQQHSEPDARHVRRKVGTAANHLERAVKDPLKKTPTIGQMLEVHDARPPRVPVPKRVHRAAAFESEAPTSLDELLAPARASPSSFENEDLFPPPDPDSRVDMAVCTEIQSEEPGFDRYLLLCLVVACATSDVCSVCALVCLRLRTKCEFVSFICARMGRDVMDSQKIDVIRRQFRIAPRSARQATGKKLPPWRGVCDFQPKQPSLPMLDLTRFIKYAHTDDQEDDEAGFKEFGLGEDCRDVVRSLRKVVQWRAPKQRTASQRIKDLVIDKQSLQGRTEATSRVAAVPAMATDLVLRIDQLPGTSGKYTEDSIRYVLRELAIMPGGILVYPDLQDGNTTAFVKFDNVEDLHSGLSQVLRLGMFAQESTVDELATFHVLYTVKKAARPQASATPNTSRPSTSSHTMLQGSRLRSSHSERTLRSPRHRATPCKARVPDLAAVGSSRPWTAPTSVEPPLQIAASWQRAPQRPGTTQSSTRPGLSLRLERAGKKLSLQHDQTS